jgi:Common central domain of tyrosinase
MLCRKGIKDLNPPEKSKFAEAALTLKNAVPSQIPAAAADGSISRWDDYVWLHLQSMHGAHRGAAFLPWHREFLRVVEQDMRKAVSDPALTIPYWDWTTARSPGDSGWPFVDDFMGGLGEADTLIVRTGPFRTNLDGTSDWVLHIVDAEPELELRRRPPGQSPPASLPTKTMVDNGLGVTPYDASPFVEGMMTNPTIAQINASYRKTNEYRFHNPPHPWVGGGFPTWDPAGSMSFMASPNDPIFFLHHCNIDRLWAVWQQKHGSPTNDYLPTAGEELGHNLPDVMAYFSPPTWPVTTTIADVIDHHAINTWYDTDKPITSMPVGSLNFGDVPSGLTTYRPIQFDVQTCRPVHFEISGFGGSSSFSNPPDQGIITVGPPVPPEDSVQANIYVQFVAPSPAGGSVTGTVTIRAYFIDTQGYYTVSPEDQFTLGTYTINLIANSIAVGVVKIPLAPPKGEVHRGMTFHIPEDQMESHEESKKKAPD